MKHYLILDTVSGFRCGGKQYRPGDIVELPENFPAEQYPFLKPLTLEALCPRGSKEARVPSDVDAYQRKTRILVKPLMVIMSVRRIPSVEAAFERLTFIDKLFIRNHRPAEVSDVINKCLTRHRRSYTHALISSDDISPTSEHIRQLIEDVALYDLPAVSGYCNMCYFDQQNQHGAVCGSCRLERPHKHINVTFLPVGTNQLSRDSYTFLPREFAEAHPSIYRVWFQGMACGMVSLETWRRVPFRSWNEGQGGLMQDLAFAEDCARLEIPQFVDFRVGIRHYGTHHGQLLVGKEPKRVDFEKARQ